MTYHIVIQTERRVSTPEITQEQYTPPEMENV